MISNKDKGVDCADNGIPRVLALGSVQSSTEDTTVLG